jgi:hypothetical protein
MRRLLLVSLASLVLLSGCASPSPRAASMGASLGGLVSYPSESAPAMRICALPASGTATCVNTSDGQREYRISGLAGGEYRVIAALTEGEMRVGGHVAEVQCIRAPCPAMLKSVLLPAGADVTGIDINGFYPSRADFPPLPGA